MQILKKLLTSNEYSAPDRRLNYVKGVVIHYVGKNNQTHGGVANYFESLKNQNKIYASAHYIVGLDGEIIQCIPDNKMAYHVGARSYKESAKLHLGTYPNNCTIGIEMCHTKDGFTDATIKSTQELVRHLMTKYSLQKSDVYRHYDVTGKLCPKFFVEDVSAWDRFLEGI